jgi:hypothetical protein
MPMMVQPKLWLYLLLSFTNIQFCLVNKKIPTKTKLMSSLPPALWPMTMVAYRVNRHQRSAALFSVSFALPNKTRDDERTEQWRIMLAVACQA